MLKMNLQLFGGRGGDSGLGGGGNENINVSNVRDLISQREEGKRNEVDATLEALRNTNDRYGYQVADITTATFDSRNANVMAFYDEAGDSVTFNKNYFYSDRMDAAYDRSIASGFHPPRGSKSGIEATAAHELGHALTMQAAKRENTDFDAIAKRVVINAAKSLGIKSRAMAAQISGYAGKNDAECIAESYADVYCNGSNARPASIAVVNELNKYARR